jgi:hypothetical protein
MARRPIAALAQQAVEEKALEPAGFVSGTPELPHAAGQIPHRDVPRMADDNRGAQFHRRIQGRSRRRTGLLSILLVRRRHGKGFGRRHNPLEGEGAWRMEAAHADAAGRHKPMDVPILRFVRR